MIKDIFDSFKDNLKERTTNPFLGTFVIVWLIKNWKLVYSLLYFDKGFTLEKRLNYISEYFKEDSFWENLFVTCFYTLVVLFITYILLSVSRLLVNFYDKNVTPWLYRITDKSSIVLKDDYNALKALVETLESKLEAERAAKIRAQEDRDNLERKHSNLSISEPDTNLESEFEAISDQIINEQRATEEVNTFIDNVYNKVALSKGVEPATFFLREEIIVVEVDRGSKATYKFTPRGKDFIRFWNNKMKETSDV